MTGEDFKSQREKLIRNLYKYRKVLETPEIIEAMSSVPRELFLTEDLKPRAYIDRPLPILKNQTISAPHMTAIFCEELDLKKGMKVLEIGAGSGYNAAVMSLLVKGESELGVGHVYTIERIPELMNFAKENIEKAGYQDNVTVIEGDGTLGYESAAPYDRICVTAAGNQVPEPLINQLKDEGRMIIPVGQKHGYQNLIIVKKKDGKIKEINRGGVAFVPLIGKYAF